MQFLNPGTFNYKIMQSLLIGIHSVGKASKLTFEKKKETKTNLSESSEFNMFYKSIFDRE